MHHQLLPASPAKVPVADSNGNAGGDGDDSKDTDQDQRSEASEPPPEKTVNRGCDIF